MTTTTTEGVDEIIMPWEDDPDWVPKTSKGKQKSPNQVRNELQRYLDSCDRTKKEVLQELGVGNGSYYKFMNPANYKNQWNAIQNDTYWAAAKLLAKVEYENKKQKKNKSTTSRKKRTSDTDTTTIESNKNNKKAKATTTTTTTTETRAEAEAWMETVLATTDANTDVVYDTCPQVIQKIKQCWKDHPGLTKAAFCKIALGGINSNSLARFLASKKQDQQGNAVYKRAYGFFEKLRILQGLPKSKARLENEQANVDGFETTPGRKFSCYFVAGEEAMVEKAYKQHLQNYSK